MTDYSDSDVRHSDASPYGEPHDGPGTPPGFRPPPAGPHVGPYAHDGAYRHVPPPPPPRNGGSSRIFFQSCLVAGCATLLAPATIAIGLALALAFAAKVGFEGASMGTFGSANIHEKVIRAGAPGRGTIAIVSVAGVIDGGGSPLEGTGMMAAVSEQVKTAVSRDDVKVILLQIDSPGGGLTASDLIYNEILQARGRGKTVVAWAASAMASGGYYVAAASDGIMASPTATVGSIGVVMQHFQVEDLLKRAGVKVDPITSGPHKDIGSMFRDMTPEERRLLQEYVDHAQRRFVDVVAKGRGMDPAEAQKYADGRIFTAAEALKAGLVDRVGYVDDALAWAEELAGEEDMRVVAYRRVLGLADIISESGRMAVREAVREVVGAGKGIIVSAERFP